MNYIIFLNGFTIKSSFFCKNNITKLLGLKGSECIIDFVNFPYTNLKELDANIDLLKKKYKSVSIVAFSFGVYYLNSYLEKNEESNFIGIKKIAVNGTGSFIGKYGVSEKVFSSTLSNLSPHTLLDFYYNIGLLDKANSEEVEEIKEYISQNFDHLKNELTYFSNNYKEVKNFVDFAYLSKSDIILPFKNSKRYYQEKNIPMKVLLLPHFIFRSNYEF